MATGRGFCSEYLDSASKIYWIYCHYLPNITITFLYNLDLLYYCKNDFSVGHRFHNPEGFGCFLKLFGSLHDDLLMLWKLVIREDLTQVLWILWPQYMMVLTMWTYLPPLGSDQAQLAIAEVSWIILRNILK